MGLWNQYNWRNTNMVQPKQSRPTGKSPEWSMIDGTTDSGLSTIETIPTRARKSKKMGMCSSTCKFLLSALFIVISLAAVILPLIIFTLPTTTTTTTTSTTTTSTTSTSTSTTTTMACAASCVNTTLSTASMIAFYTFDSVTTDSTGTYPLSGISSPTYVSGWIGSAISFNAALAQRLSTSNLPLNNGPSFTIDFWFYATNVSSGWDIPFMGQYSAQLTDQCLFLSIYFTKLYIGFFADDNGASTILAPNTWYHAAFTFDSSTMLRSIYLNGVLDGQATATGLLQATAQPFTIGGATVGGRVATFDSYYTGYIDHVRISTRAKSACEIYLDANLACYFTFDSASPPLDSSASGLSATNTGATLITGAINQALQFSSANTYVTVSDISALQTGNNPTFSISMWIRPTTIASGGTIIHAATQANGQGTCVTLWGLTSIGHVSVNVLDSSNNANAAIAPTALQINVWTHVAQTFSPTNGNRLYINGMLVTTTSVPTGRPVGPYTIIGTALSGTTGCPAGSIVTGQFYGGVDEYRVFRTELTATDICRLSNPL